MTTLSSVSPVFGRGGQRLVKRPTLGLKLDELARNVVVSSLGENPQNGPAGLVEVNAAGERTPQCATRPLDDVSHL